MFSVAPFSATPFSSLPAGGSSVIIALTGLEATSAVGAVTIEGQAYVYLSGLEATSSVGTVATTAAANVAVTGFSATGNVGVVSVTGKAVVGLTGVQGTTALGSATVEADAIVTVTGVTATAENGAVTVIGKAVITLTGLEGVTALGSASVEADANVPLTGVSATSAIGSVSVIAKAVVSLTGLQADAYVADAIVWGEVVTNDGSLTPQLLEWVDTKQFNDYFQATEYEELSDWGLWSSVNKPTSGTIRTVYVGYGDGDATRLNSWNLFDSNVFFYAMPTDYAPAYGNQRQYLSMRLTSSGYSGAEVVVVPKSTPGYPATFSYKSYGMGYGIELSDNTGYPAGDPRSTLGLYAVPVYYRVVEWRRTWISWYAYTTVAYYKWDIVLVPPDPLLFTPVLLGTTGSIGNSLEGDWRIRTYDQADGKIGWAFDKLDRETFAQGAKMPWETLASGSTGWEYLTFNPSTTRTYGGLILPETPFSYSGSPPTYGSLAPPYAVTDAFRSMHWGVTAPWGDAEVITGDQTASSWKQIVT